SSERMSSLALSENSRILRMVRVTSWISLGSLSGPKTSTASTPSVSSSSAPMSLNTLLLLVFSACSPCDRGPGLPAARTAQRYLSKVSGRYLAVPRGGRPCDHGRGRPAEPHQLPLAEPSFRVTVRSLPPRVSLRSR